VAQRDRGFGMSAPSAAAFDRIAALGPFFAVQGHARASAPGGPWRPMRELVTEPELLAERVRAVRAQLAASGGRPAEAVEPRVAASVTHLSLVARLMSPALAGAAILGLELLPVGLDGVHWQPLPGGMFPLSLPLPAQAPTATGATAPTDRLAALLGESLLDRAARELVEAVRPLSVSARVLWGNVASALVGAATVLVGSPHTSPAQAARAREITALLLDHPTLRGTAETDARGRFRRRSCCLIYRAAPRGAGGFCADCVLSAPGRAARGPRRSGTDRPMTGGSSGVS